MAKCHPAAVAAVLARSHWKWRSIGDTQFVATALPYCDSPRAVELTARIPRRDLRQGVYDPIGGGGQVTATVNVPCRKCAKCLHWRSMQWSERAMKECLFAKENGVRTIWVTLTLNAKARDQMYAQASLACAGEPKFGDLSRVALGWFQDYLKRLRYIADKEHSAKLRFLAVTEPHKDGCPHIHMLVHGNIPTKIFRKAKWGNGFIHAKISDEQTAKYLCKYISKEAGRVRASLAYGHPERSARTKTNCEIPSNSDRVSVQKEPTLQRGTSADDEKGALPGEIALRSTLAASVWNGELDVRQAEQIWRATERLAGKLPTNQLPPLRYHPAIDKSADVAEGAVRPEGRTGEPAEKRARNANSVSKAKPARGSVRDRVRNRRAVGADAKAPTDADTDGS